MMQTHARVVVIGGGVLGCSVIYHLTKLGWTDVLLLERKELTAGSTWHAAGGFHTINGNANVARLQAYTCGIYREIEELSGQNVGAHYCGGLLVAATDVRWEFLRAEHARHKVLGLTSELIGPDEIKKLVPIMDVTDVRGAIYDPLEGYLDPYGATHAYARAARNAGARIERHTKVEGLTRLASGEWRVQTDRGDVLAEHVINAAGLWAREVGQMAGVTLPLVPMEHHYLITEDLPELIGLDREIPQVADLDGGLYLRQEHRGILLGVYERNAVPWALEGTPWDYAEDALLIPDLERLGDDLTHGFERFPAVANAGIKRIVNGPFTFSPDGNPLVGPVKGLPGYWVAAGCMAGFVQGGGIGRSLAEWMVDGQPSIDVFGMDVARFDPAMTEGNVVARAREFYSRRFDIPYPNETWPVGRPAKTSPLFDEHRAKNAVFMTTFGFEVPAYFALTPEQTEETPTFYRSDAFPFVAEECRAAREAVSVLEISATAKFVVDGADAEMFVRRIIASPLPGKRCSVPTVLLNRNGRLIGDANVARLSDGRFLLTGPTFMQAIYDRWFEEHGRDFDVRIDNVSERDGGLLVIGPRASELLDLVTGYRQIGSKLDAGEVADCGIGPAPCLAVANAKLGCKGFELYTPLAQLLPLYRTLFAHGGALGIRDIGVRAYSALSMESAPGATLREVSQDHTLAELGWGALLDTNRDDAIGITEARATIAVEPAAQMVGLLIETADADPIGDEPVWLGDKYVGHTSSGLYGHTIGSGIAIAFLDKVGCTNGGSLEVEILGVRRAAQISALPFVRADGASAERGTDVSSTGSITELAPTGIWA